jgi:hypothetical protein
MLKTPLSTVLGGAFWTPRATILGGASKTFIQSLFANGEKGFFYDTSDMWTMFQDAAGTIPVTAAGQPVGLIRDKSGLNNHAYSTTSSMRPIFEQKPILGANFVTDSTLAQPSKWNTGAASGVSVSGNKLIFNNVAANHLPVSSRLNSARLTVGKRYLLSYIISGYVSGAVRAQLSGSALMSTTSFNKNGRVSLAITAWAGHSSIGFQSTAAGTTLNISEVYLWEITGYLAAQNHIKYDGVDDKLITTLPAQLTGCTVVRAVPNVGTQILTNQTIPTTYNDNTDHCGLVVINRALTATETSQITKLFNKAAGV